MAPYPAILRWWIIAKPRSGPQARSASHTTGRPRSPTTPVTLYRSWKKKQFFDQFTVILTLLLISPQKVVYNENVDHKKQIEEVFWKENCLDLLTNTITSFNEHQIAQSPKKLTRISENFDSQLCNFSGGFPFINNYRVSFVVSIIIKVEVGVISLSWRLRLITLTETFIIPDIIKAESNN